MDNSFRKTIELPSELFGDEITKGEGIWEKEYTYIYIPGGYGYDNYCFRTNVIKGASQNN